MTDNAAVDRMGSLFNDFLAAAEAIKQRPQLEAQVKDAEAARDRANAQSRYMEERYNTLSTDYDSIKAQLAKLEADLAQATFREAEVRSKLEAVVSVLKDTMTEAKAAVELVEPKPEPVPEVNVPEVTVETPFPYTPREHAYEYTDNPQTEGQSEAHPTLSATTTLESSAPAPIASGQVGVNSIAKPYEGKSYWEKPNDMSYEAWEAGGGDTPYWYKSNKHNTEGQSVAHPTAYSMDDTSFYADSPKDR